MEKVVNNEFLRSISFPERPLAFPIFAEKRIHVPWNDQGLNHVPVTTRVRPLPGTD
jgi:hypothetical protein